MMWLAGETAEASNPLQAEVCWGFDESELLEQPELVGFDPDLRDRPVVDAVHRDPRPLIMTALVSYR